MRMFFALLTTICRPHLPCSEVDGSVDRGRAFIIPFAEGERLKCGSSSGAVR
jgi:hypothetical protein